MKSKTIKKLKVMPAIRFKNQAHRSLFGETDPTTVTTITVTHILRNGNL